MPFLPSSGALSIDNIKAQFGGPASPSLSNYYRGGVYVPSSKTVSSVVREPASGDYYQGGPYQVGVYNWITRFSDNAGAAWAGSYVPLPYGSATSTTIGGITYYRGGYRTSVMDNYADYYFYYGIYRTYTGTSTTNINTNVPTSGQISISQFYGAEKP